MNAYHLPKGYKENAVKADYVDTDDGVQWQIGAYNLALELAPGHKAIVDIGCGGARKLHRFVPLGLPIIGYDRKFGAKDLPWIDAREVDLAEYSKPLLEGIAQPALVICADVIEHLEHPLWLISELIQMALDGNTVVLTTPDRELTHGVDDNGPPPNPAHVREWNAGELRDLIDELTPEASKHLLSADLTFTQTTDRTPERNTTTLCMTRKK